MSPESGRTRVTELMDLLHESEFDIKTFDFHDKEAVSRLRWKAPLANEQVAATLHDLRLHQRLLRIHGDPEITALLHEHGFRSAHHIAAMPEQQFVDQFASARNGNEQLARTLHRRAVQVKARVKHLAANVRDLVASPYYRRTLFYNVGQDIIDYFEGIPSYQSLFGSLDFCDCEHCRSIFGPAAYFVDIMRITDQYITQRCPKIPDGYRLSDRRPDLFTLELTCENTNRIVPFLQLVNEIMEQKLRSDLNQDAYQTLALAPYPFNLPFQLPLEQIRLYLSKLDCDLPAIYKSLLAENPAALGFTDIRIAQESLGLSPEQVALLIAPDPSPAGMSRSYGYDDVTRHLPAPGPGTISLQARQQSAVGQGVNFSAVLSPGQQIRVGDQVRTVTEVAPTEIKLDFPWMESATNAAYSIYLLDRLADLTTVNTFLYRTGLALPELRDLLTQDLSRSEREAGLADQLFINSTGEGLPYLRIFDGGDQDNPVLRLHGLSLKRLDRLSRFIRLSHLTGIPFTALNWLMVTAGAEEITPDFILALASIRQIAGVTGLTLEETAAFLHPMKSTGKGDGDAPVDLFDRLFNAPALLQGANPFTAATPIPFDPNRPLAWNVTETPDNPTAKGVARGGTRGSITLAAGASTLENAYVGFSVTIVNGTGKGQYGVIRAYDGTSKVATIYTEWETAPDSTSEYAITNAPNLVNRLAAALQVKQTNLTLVGTYLQVARGKPGQPLLLDLNTLTELYRLTRMAAVYGLSIDEYLTLRGILFGAAGGQATLADLQKTVTNCIWLKDSGFSVYDLQYALTGARSRYLRLAYNDQEIPGFTANLADSARSVRLTAEQLTGAGLDEEAASAAYRRLLGLGYRNETGIVLLNHEAYDYFAGQYPVANTAFASGLISEAESKQVFATLARQHPPVINVKGGASQGVLSIYYTPDTALDYLFIGDSRSAEKRQQVRGVLSAVSARIAFTMFAQALPVSRTDFVTPDADLMISDRVFEALVEHGVLLPVGGYDSLASLATDFDSTTPLGYLFDSQGAGQHRLITAYDGATRAATVDAAWTTALGAFSFYQVLQVEGQGTAQAGTAGTITLAADASAKDGYYISMQVEITAGPGAGEVRRIAAYDGTTKLATVEGAWSTPPDTTSAYRITGAVLLEGTAAASTSSTIVFAAGAAEDDGAYKDLVVAIIPDPKADAKRGQVQDSLLGRKAQIAALADIVVKTLALQVATAAGGLANFLGTTEPQVTALLPYTERGPSLADLLPSLLDPNPTDSDRSAVTSLIDGLSRAGLVADKLQLSTTELSAIARRPEHFDMATTSHLSLGDIKSLQAFKAFTRGFQDSDDGLLRYFDMEGGGRCPDAKTLALHGVTGWDPDQICQLSAILWPGQVGSPGTMAGLLRLGAPFALIGSFGFDATYLQQTTTLAGLSVGTVGQNLSTASWALYTKMAQATLAAVGAHYPEAEFTALAEQLAGAVEVRKRDALLGYTIWHLQKRFPIIREPDDLFQFLLIDVEMSGCDSTSYIATAINSVQLYMQRVRMGLEPEADTSAIPEIWWTWMSAYRVWEANRRVFLYPENYIEPTLRRNATPQFRDLMDNLLQNPITDENVSTAYMRYFDDFAVLGNLVHVGGYHTRKFEGGKDRYTLYLVARSNTTPYKYYVRARERFSDCNQATWGPWREIKLTINAAYVTPVFAFDRLFLFWVESEPIKSSKIQGTPENTSSESQSILRATINYSFQTVTGEWVPPQELVSGLPYKVDPNNNTNMANAYLATAFESGQLYFQQPYALGIARGIAGTGTLTFAQGSMLAVGEKTDLAHQLSPGDEIWVAGQRRFVKGVNLPEQRIEVDQPFAISTAGAPFKVIPHRSTEVTFPPFQGDGSVYVKKGLQLVDGVGNTRFPIQVAVGDALQIKGETRIVVTRVSDTQLLVDRPWEIDSTSPGPGLVSTWAGLQNVVGTESFEGKIAPGELIIVGGETREVVDIPEPNELLVAEPFSKTNKDAAYSLNDGAYNVIPRAGGAERMLVVFGPKLEVGKIPKPNSSGHDPNPGDDPFIAGRNQFNQSLNGALALGNAAGEMGLRGDVAGSVAILLANDLTQQSLRVLARDYDPLGLSIPVQTRVQREYNVWKLFPSTNLVDATFWANNAPGSQLLPGDGTSGGRELLYHISGEKASVYGVGNQVGGFLFNNVDQAFLVNLANEQTSLMSDMAFVYNFTSPGEQGVSRVDFGPYTLTATPFDQMKFRYTRLTTSTVQPLKQRLFGGGIPLLLTLDSQRLPEIPFDTFYSLPEKGDPPPTLDTAQIPPSRMDFDGALGLYFQEIFFHGPLLVADRLKTNQSFADAKRWYEYIFNPTGRPEPDDKHPNDRYWRYLPFRSMEIETLKQILTIRCEIDAYNSDPFNPDAIAGLRISAYAKATVMKYIDNLIQWGDALFAQDSREAIAQASQLYILARDLLGRRPISVGACSTAPPLTFEEIKRAYPDGIPEFLIDLENTPFVLGDPDEVRFADVPFNDIHAYFCVPENAEFMGYWDRVEDRLYKIRHCMNIKGMERPLALFAPPINPRALIQAFGSAGSLMGAASYAPMPVPPYRFTTLVGQARNIVGDVIRLGQSLLSALERKDSEALGMLRLTQEARLLELTTKIKEQQIKEQEAQQESLNQSLTSARERKQHYDTLMKDGLLPEEIAQVVSMGLAAIFTVVGIGLKTAASINYALPNVGSPLAMTYGGRQTGASLQEAANVMRMLSTTASFAAESMGLRSVWTRREQDWKFQSRMAEIDESMFQAQINAAKIRVEMAQRQLEIHKTEIAQQQQTERFYQTKFTNEDLYNWMIDRIAGTYFMAYSVAIDLARLAQRAYQFEYNTETEYIRFGYWDSLHKGLNAGDGLLLALNQMEKTYTQQANRPLEIQRTISLRQLNPLALLQLIQTGECVFELPESLFDADFPGHYRRKIKTLSVSVPAVVGPYQNIKATLSQTGNQIIVQPNLDAVRFLLGDESASLPAADVLQSNVRNYEQIALSTGQNDAGLFTVDLNDPRYLPFEGTGAVSSWKLSMMPSSNTFDFGSLSDLILELQYTAVDGGREFRKKVADLPQLKNRDWSQVIMVSRQDPTAWHAFLHTPPVGNQQRLEFPLPPLALPNMRETRLVGFYFRLQVPEGAKTTSQRPFINLQLTRDGGTSLSLSRENDFVYAYDPSVPMDSLTPGARVIFNLDNTPAALKEKDQNRLDPAKVQDIDLVLFLQGKVQ